MLHDHVSRLNLVIAYRVGAYSANLREVRLSGQSLTHLSDESLRWMAGKLY